MSLIACRNASFGYDGGTAVSDLNFEVNNGDYLCVVGENGSGKSTLIKGLLSLIPVKTGSVELGGGLRRSEIGYLPQQTAAQKDFPASAYEVVLSGRLSARGWAPFYTREDRRIADENIRLLGAESLAKRCYRELSGGQQQRVLLARALCATRKLIILDEPTAGLDPVVTQELYRLIETVNKKAGVAVMMVSHDVRAAARYADHLLHLSRRQVFFGTARDYAASDIGSAFLSWAAIPTQGGLDNASAG